MEALILGYGSSGKAAEALAKQLGYDVEVLTDEKSTSSGKDVADDSSPPRGGQETSATNGGAAFAVVSPGVPLTSPLISECRAKGVPLKSELQFGCEELKRQGWKLLAVTGSKGKSSVVKVVADAINLSGQYAVACGNYGLPVCDVANHESRITNHEPPTTNRWAVVEVSSFMMETTELPADTFEAAAILNLQEDHLDRHGSVEVYHALKRRLLTMAKQGIVAEVSRPPRGGQASSATLHLFAGSYFDNDVLKTNARCAVELMRVAGLNDAGIAAAFKAFEPLPHRMNRIAEIDGVEYIDDSKATSLAALIAGVSMASSSVSTSTSNLQPHIRLIAGGLPKGDDPKSAVSILTERVKKVYLIGQSAEAFASAWKSYVDCEICGTMEAAVAAAKREAVKGDKVLLSPGAASFDQFKSFGERGEVFARLVKKEKQIMNKLAVVLGVAAVATLAGCKDPEYARIKPGAQNEVKSIATEPAAAPEKKSVDEVKPAEVVKPVEVVAVKDEAPKCKCVPGTKHDKPCECGADDCQCIVEVKPVEPEYTVYIVQKGDYLAKISKKYNIKVDAIKKLNNMTSDNVRLGQKLKLPGKVEVGEQEVPAGAKAAPVKKAYESYKGATKEYVVVSGDSLGKIAYSNGMNIRQLKELNGLTKDTVYVGQKLKIADKGAAPAVAAKPAPAVAEAKKPALVTAAGPVVTEPVKPVVETKAVETKPVEPAVADTPVSAEEVKPDSGAAAEGTTNYVVQDGDDLPTIAIEFRVPVARLRELNNLGEGDEVKAGQVLKIPAEQ